jgi:hypothetical protein
LCERDIFKLKKQSKSSLENSASINKKLSRFLKSKRRAEATPDHEMSVSRRVNETSRHQAGALQWQQAGN